MTTQLLENHPLLSIAIRSFVLLAITFSVALACRRRSAAVIHRIWTLGFCGCLLIPIVTLLSPDWTLPILPTPSGVEATAEAIIPGNDAFDLSVPNFQPIRLAQMRTSDAMPHSADARASADETRAPLHETIDRSQNNWRSLESWLWTVWCAGLTFMLLRMAQQVLLMRRTVRQCTVIDNTVWYKLRDAAADQLGLRKKVAMRSHPGAVSPMIAGFARPVVVLPTEAEKWSVERRTMVLLHELAHVQRRDLLTQTIAGVVCALYWFNPLTWWAAFQMQRLREVACDDTVVRLTPQPGDYAQTLLDVAKDYRSRQQICVVAMASTNNVAGRITAVLDTTRRRASLTKRSARLIGAVALFLSVLVGALQLTSRADDPKESQDGRQSTTETVQESRTALIRVLDETGQPLSQVKVHVTGIGPKGNLPRLDYPTNAQGEAEITFPHGTRVLQLWPSKQGYVPQVVSFRESEREKDKAIPKEYEFHFQPGNRLSGLVVDSSGKPIVRAKVQVKLNGEAKISDKSKNAVPRAGVNTWLAFGSGAAVTDAQGRWEINNAPTLTVDSDSGFQLMVTHPKFTGDRNWGECQQRQGITLEQLRDGTAKLTMDRGIAISGLITGPDGEKVTKGLVIWDDRPYWATGVNETQIDEQGRYKTLRLAPGDYPVTVVAPGYAPDERTISVSPSLKDVDFQLKRGNPIRIKIVDQYGYAIPKAGVSIGQWRGTEAIYNHKHSNVPESGIPRRANADGVYAWDWAPADGVQYQFGAKGYDAKEVTLVPKIETHIVELVRPTTILGTVVDAESGDPIEQFRVIPVKAFRPDFYSTNFQTGSIAHGKDGDYKIQINSHGQTGNRYRVRIEAEGYRTAFGQKSLAVGDPPLEEHFELEKSPSRVGKVLSPSGEPASEFTVVIGTPTIASRFSLDRLDTSFSKSFRVQGKDQFELPATFEPRRIRVFNDSGFAELLRQPDEPIGTINLQPWASVSGHLVQGGKPISNEWINFYPLARRGLTEARFQGSFSAKTDLNGYFNFDRLPPMSGSVKAYLGPWQDSVLTSSRSVSLDLEAGDHEEISLGGEGAAIAGRVVATGRSNDSLSKNWSLNYLVSRGQGIAYPRDVEPLSFDPSGPLNAAWLRQPDFNSWLATRENHFVKLADDGRLRIHGVRPGSYDLVIQLYEQPSGCLVETIGEKVLPVNVTEDQVGAVEVSLGNIEVQCRIGPRAGTDMRAFKFTDSDGRVRLINDMSDRYVLLHVWASWCQPCLESMPEVQAAVEQHADDRLTVVGLNIDEDAAAAKSLVQAGGWNWAHTYLGDGSDMMRQLAVSSVPAYYLIGPDGKLVGSANAWEQVQPLLSDSLR